VREVGDVLLNANDRYPSQGILQVFFVQVVSYNCRARLGLSVKIVNSLV
jgi:hypothetical protein